MDEADATSGFANKTNESVTSQEPNLAASSSMAIPPLGMIHAVDKETSANSNTAPTSTAFMSHEDHVYQLGGRVNSEINDGEQVDVMV